jgi:membrane protein
MDQEPTSRFDRVKEQVTSLVTDESISEETAARPLHAFLHFWVLVGRSFVRNRCPVRATALAYTTLLALIPLLAVSLGVSTSLLKSDTQQTRQMIEHLVNQMAPQLEQLPGSEQEKLEARHRVIEQIQDFIANIHSGALGLTGTLGLVFVAIGLLSTIEITFNDIWGVSRGRSWFSRIIHYWAAITLGPLIVLLAMGLAVSAQFFPADAPPPPTQAATNQVASASAVGPATAAVGATNQAPSTLTTQRRTSAAAALWRQILQSPVGRVVFGLLPFLILSASFSLLYQLMPNTQVNWKAAAVGGLVGAVLWILNSRFNVVFASRVVSASKIYGPLGVFPVFLIGLYISWLILLFGAQVSYAFQNRQAYLQEKLAETVNQRGREFVALRLMLAVGDRFRQGLLPPTLAELAQELGVSGRLVAQLVERLRQSQLLIELNAPAAAYAPSRPLDRITTGDILWALRVGRGQEPATRPGCEREVARAAFTTVQEAERRAAEPITLEQLLERALTSRSTVAPG